MKKKPHYAYVILAACCLIQGGTLGVIQNCRGIFYGPVCEDLGFEMGAFTFYMLFFAVCSCLMLPFAGKVFHRVNVRLLMGAASVVFAGGFMLQAAFDSLPAFYIAGAVQGLAGAYLLYYPIPVLLGNWFRKKRGFAIGLAAAMAGLTGAVMSPIGAAMIASWGWRAASVGFGLVALLLSAPASFFLIFRTPGDKGCTAYGMLEEKEELTGVSYETAKKSRAYPLTILLALLLSFICGYYLPLASYGTTEGFAAEFGARMTSMCMIGNIVSKVLLGWFYDRKGLRRTMYAGMAVVIAGFACLLVRQPACMYIGAVGVGFGMGVSTVMTPILVREVYGSRDYGQIASLVTVATTLGSAVSTVTMGILYDQVGSYRPGIMLGAVMAVVSMILMEMVLYFGRSLRRAPDLTK